VWRSGKGSYVLCGIVGRLVMYCVAEWGERLCVFWHSGEDRYVFCGIVGRAVMFPVA